jgi:hypothetical protein
MGGSMKDNEIASNITSKQIDGSSDKDSSSG